MRMDDFEWAKGWVKVGGYRLASSRTKGCVDIFEYPEFFRVLWAVGRRYGSTDVDELQARVLAAMSPTRVISWARGRALDEAE